MADQTIPDEITTSAEMIGAPYNTLTVNVQNMFTTTPTHDLNRTDAAFYDKVRRGKAKGLEMAGLFIKPLASKTASWVMGTAPNWKVETEEAQTALNDWWAQNHADILRAYEESLVLADHFMVLNGDESLSVIQPTVVRPVVDEEDYSQITGWTIRQVYPHPTRAADKMEIIDTYTAERRTQVKIKNGKQTASQTFINPLGMIPVIHIANTLGSDEEFGRSEAEPIIYILHKYGAVLEAAIDGNKRMGRPVPVIEQLGTDHEVQQFWERFGTRRTVYLPDGTTQTITELKLDADKVITLGGTATFNFKAPPSFTGDTQTLLQLMFYLILQHTEIPEFAWGNAIQSSQASASTQLEPFVKWVEKKRSRAIKWLNQLAKLVLALKGLTSTMEGLNKLNPQAQWPPLTARDGSLTLQAVEWAMEQGLLDRETALRKAPLDITDVEDVLHKADAEKPARDAAKQDQTKAAVSQLAGGAQGIQQRPPAIPGERRSPMPAGEQPTNRRLQNMELMDAWDEALDELEEQDGDVIDSYLFEMDEDPFGEVEFDPNVPEPIDVDEVEEGELEAV